MMIDVWYPVPEGRLSQEFSDSMTGRDLWLCIDGRVYGGHHFSGFKEGFYLSSYDRVEKVGKLTHVMLREYPPPPPESKSWL